MLPSLTLGCVPYRYVTVYARKYTDGKGKEHTKAPKVQRLVTPLTLQRKRKRLAIKKGRIAKVPPPSHFILRCLCIALQLQMKEGGSYVQVYGHQRIDVVRGVKGHSQMTLAFLESCSAREYLTSKPLVRVWWPHSCEYTKIDVCIGIG